VAQQARQILWRIDPLGERGHGGEQRTVRDLLVGVARLRGLAAGHRHDRGAVQIGVLQPSGEIRSADALRETHTDPAGGPRIAVGHVGSGLLAVREHAPDAEPFQFDQRAAQYGIDEEHVSDAVGGEHLRDHPRARGCVHGVSSVPGLCVPRRLTGRKGAPLSDETGLGGRDDRSHRGGRRRGRIRRQLSHRRIRWSWPSPGRWRRRRSPGRLRSP
jgi:hypothetical protein